MVIRNFLCAACTYLAINKLIFYFKFLFLVVMISLVAACGSGGGDSGTDGDNTTTYYQDSDGDDYGNLAVTQVATSQPAGYVSNKTDCDDGSAAVNPGATEISDGIDNNCDGQVDEGFITYYQDADSDGYGDPTSIQVANSTPAGYVLDNSDCDDGSAAVNPGATEISDGIDNNCDGQVDENAVPNAPTSVQATAGDASVNLTWLASSGATGYTVYWSATAGVTTNDGSVDVGMASTYNFDGLVNSTTYYYRVTARNSVGESALSSEVSATPLSMNIPSAPQNVNGIGSNGFVDLHWDAVPGAMSYNIYWNTSGSVTTSDFLVSTPAPPFSHGKLTNDATYYYMVTAVNDAGESMPSNEVAIKAASLDSGEIVFFENETMFKVNPSSGLKVTLPWTIRLPSDVAYDQSGNLFVADLGDQTYPYTINSGHGPVILHINPVTGEQKVISSRGMLVKPNKIMIASNGDLLVADQTIIRINPITGEQTDLLSDNTQIKTPIDIAYSIDGNYFIADQNLNQIWEVDATTGVEKLIASGDNLTSMYGLAISSNNLIYIINSERIGTSATWSSKLIMVNPSNGVQNIVTTAFNLAVDVVIDSSDNIFVLDGNLVYQVDGTSGAITERVSSSTLGGPSLSLDNFNNLVSVSPSIGVTNFKSAYIFGYDFATTDSKVIATGDYEGDDVIVDSDGSLLVSSLFSHQSDLGRVNPDTAEVTKICCDNGYTESLMAIVHDGNGSVVAATLSNEIVRINLTTGAVSTITSGGELNFSYYTNVGMAIDGNGDLLVAQGTSGIIRVDLTTGNQVVEHGYCPYPIQCYPTDIKINDSGDWFVANVDYILKYDIQLLQPLVLANDVGRLSDVGFSEIAISLEGNIIAHHWKGSWDTDPNKYTLQHIDTSTGTSTAILNNLDWSVHGLAVSP